MKVTVDQHQLCTLLIKQRVRIDQRLDKRFDSKSGYSDNRKPDPKWTQLLEPNPSGGGGWILKCREGRKQIQDNE